MKVHDNFCYPGNNRVITVTRGATTVRSLAYDNGGNLTSDSGAGVTKTYTYNNRNRLATATIGAATWAYTYNAKEQLAIRTQTAGGTGSTHYIHDIWGNVIAETAGGGATGTGLHYNWHRSYDPTLGRYTQPDPLGFVDGPSVYAYAGGLPQQAVHPDGRNIGSGVAIGTVILARYCLKNPDKCRKNLRGDWTLLGDKMSLPAAGMFYLIYYAGLMIFVI
jgi:RHS repeat-associated protein